MSSHTEHNPFVGLRPFESDESLLFFGRQEQISDVLHRLHAHHFVGIVGSSGSGKSSLIKAGLIPRLKAGYLVGDRDHWFMATSKPGDSPFYNLISALLSKLKPGSTAKDAETLAQKIRTDGLPVLFELLENAVRDGRTNVLILIDQFEEIFRYIMGSDNDAAKDEAIDFVNLLLELSDKKELSVYVVITLRSDFIGDCAQFFGLPEALNQSQYLVPRLTRVQMREVIEGPVKLYGGSINPALTSRLINEVDRVQDELPLLQHVLMRTWDYEMKTDNNGELDLHDYEAVGGIEHALSKHADEALQGMSESDLKWSEMLFKGLTTTDFIGRKIRRPAHLNELAGLAGAEPAKIRKLIDHFNDDKRSFLVVSKGDKENNPLVDISHESLIRQWETLENWVEEEAQSVKTYMQICESASLNKEGKKDLLSGAELDVALAWQKEHNPDSGWASRYSGDFKAAMDFLNKSVKQSEIDKEQKEEARKTALLAKEQKKLLRRTMTLLVIIALFLVAAVFSTISFYQQKKLARAEELKAKKALEINTRALDSLYVAAEKVQADCWDKFIPVEIVLREGNPNYVKLSERLKNNQHASMGNTDGTTADYGTEQDQISASDNSQAGNTSNSDPASNATQATPSQGNAPPAAQSTTSPSAIAGNNGSGQSADGETDANGIPLSVDSKPSFPGGNAAMKRFIMDNLDYPQQALQNGKSGVVKLKFVVAATGKIQDVDIIGPRLGYGLEEAAMDVLRKMPLWNPAMSHGKKVPYYYTLPISFIPPTND